MSSFASPDYLGVQIKLNWTDLKARTVGEFTAIVRVSDSKPESY